MEKNINKEVTDEGACEEELEGVTDVQTWDELYDELQLLESGILHNIQRITDDLEEDSYI